MLTSQQPQPLTADALGRAPGEVRPKRPVTGPDRLGVVRKSFEQYADGDIQGAISVIDDDFEIVDNVRVDTGYYRGRAGLERWLREWIEVWDDWGFAADHFVAAGRRVVVLCRQWGRARSSGIGLEWRCAIACTVVRDRVVRMEYFACWADALSRRLLAG